ncbi:hypothetical protein WOLCODRAFT_165520 [Wolfiporia cocos MD-104 SS10]|uniref:Uncharacterized protein n=1 Tax=Wolfiporia cocos (strain MD-104) TaxID=742152 RepID=A0A2H3K458_WOLCO|nr:hypothetical protein WOLCODRAFT_165520 [Wolfiporia cocos MD-104 SS10]
MSGTLSMFRSFAADAAVLQEELMRKISASLSENINELKLAIFGLHQRNEEDQIASVSRVDAAIQAAIEHHSTSLIALAPTFERSLQTHIDRVLQYMLEQYQGISTVADVAHASLTTIGRELDSVERTIGQLVSTAEQANGHVKKNAEQAQEANILQLETTGHAVKLAAIVTDLTTLAHAELQNISDTAYAVQERMRLSGHRLVDGQWSQWTKACAMYILEIVLRVDPERLECILHSPMFRIISMLTHLCWWLLQSGFSSLMSALLLFASVKQWLPAPFDRRSALNGKRQQSSIHAHLAQELSLLRTVITVVLAMQTFWRLPLPAAIVLGYRASRIGSVLPPPMA